MRNPPTTPNIGKSFCRAGVGNVQRAMLSYPVNLWLINTDLDVG